MTGTARVVGEIVAGKKRECSRKAAVRVKEDIQVHRYTKSAENIHTLREQQGK